MADEQLTRISEGQGFIAALDQSGGSTPKALKLYGIDESQYSNDEEMFDRIHETRTRIITSPSFTSDRVIAAILFEGTLAREIEGLNSAEFLWKNKGIVPILKIDKGLEAEADGVQLLKDIPGLEDTLANAKKHGVFGTKERSVVKSANEKGIENVVAQQFELGKRVLAAGLYPILEPEVDINAPDKAAAEELLKASILKHLDDLSDDQKILLKITIPSVDGFYSDVISHPKVLRVVALSGGYEREDANARLSRNPGLIASFSRALTEGLNVNQSDEEFNKTLDESIEGIYQASIA